MQRLGFTSFQPGQLEALYGMTLFEQDQKHMVMCVGTGGGKSVAYILRAMMTKKILLFVVPITALLQDQKR